MFTHSQRKDDSKSIWLQALQSLIQKLVGTVTGTTCLLSLRKFKKISQKDQMTDPHRTNDFYCLVYSNYVLMRTKRNIHLPWRGYCSILENAITAGTEEHSLNLEDGKRIHRVHIREFQQLSFPMKIFTSQYCHISKAYSVCCTSTSCDHQILRSELIHSELLPFSPST